MSSGHCPQETFPDRIFTARRRILRCPDLERPPRRPRLSFILRLSRRVRTRGVRRREQRPVMRDRSQRATAASAPRAEPSSRAVPERHTAATGGSATRLGMGPAEGGNRLVRGVRRFGYSPHTPRGGTCTGSSESVQERVFRGLFGVGNNLWITVNDFCSPDRVRRPKKPPLRMAFPADQWRDIGAWASAHDAMQIPEHKWVPSPATRRVKPVLDQVSHRVPGLPGRVFPRSSTRCAR